MSAFSIYILGAAISGLIFVLLTYIPSFFNYLCDSIDKAKDEMKNSGEYDDMEMALLNGIDNNTIINYLNIIIALLSWIGLCLVILYTLSWLLDKINIKNK